MRLSTVLTVLVGLVIVGALLFATEIISPATPSGFQCPNCIIFPANATELNLIYPTESHHWTRVDIDPLNLFCNDNPTSKSYTSKTGTLKGVEIHKVLRMGTWTTNDTSEQTGYEYAPKTGFSGPGTYLQMMTEPPFPIGNDGPDEVTTTLCGHDMDSLVRTGKGRTLDEAQADVVAAVAVQQAAKQAVIDQAVIDNAQVQP